jgi:hypothetical protein
MVTPRTQILVFYDFMTRGTMTSSSASSSCPSAISLGSCIYGIPIRLHYSFFLLLLLQFVSALLSHGQYPILMLFVVVLYGPILLVTILVRDR